MTRVSIPESSAVPMEHVAPGVSGLRIAFVNVYAVAHADASWTLVDTGLPFCAGLISSWVQRHFATPPAAIVLTHGHFDHVGAARELADKWDISIYAHPEEFPYLSGQREYAPPDFGAGGGLMSFLSPLYSRAPVHLGDRLLPLPLEDHAAIENPVPAWTVVHTPGHTPGHISLFRSADRTLIAGDAFCTTKPESFFDAAILQPPELHGPPAYFTPDWAAASLSIQKLAELNPAIVAPGHGKALSGESVPAKLHQLADQFRTAA
jgi:glyoxylase-like metal-dependent hydrolase (beta-lactamase superfamily II)